MMKAQMFNDQRWLHSGSIIDNGSPDGIRAVFDDILKRSGFSVVNYMEHRFQPHGFTAIWLLAESHLAIHTFPEEELVYVEMSSCVEDPHQMYLQHMHVMFGGKITVP